MPRRVVVLLVVVCIATVGVGWASKARCIDERLQKGGNQFADLCYTDVAVIWFNRGQRQGSVPYTETELEYPVLIGAQVAALAAVAHALDGGYATFLLLHLPIAAALAVVVLLLLRRMGVPPVRLWCWALAPPLALYALWNWDLLALALLVGALTLHREGRDTAAAAVTGLGTAAKLFPGLLLLVLVLVALRRGDRRAAVRAVAAAGGAWLAVNLPVALAAPEGWWRFYGLSLERDPTPASTWGTAQLVTGTLLPDALVGRLSTVSLAAGVLAVLVIGARRVEPASMWRLVTPLVAVFLLAAKVHSPQFDLWLVPLLLLTLPDLRPLLAFVVVDAAVVVTEMQRLLDPTNALWMQLAVAARTGVLVWIVVASLRALAAQRQPGSSSRSAVPLGDSGMAYQMGTR